MGVSAEASGPTPVATKRPDPAGAARHALAYFGWNGRLTAALASVCASVSALVEGKRGSGAMLANYHATLRSLTALLAAARRLDHEGLRAALASPRSTGITEASRKIELARGIKRNRNSDAHDPVFNRGAIAVQAEQSPFGSGTRSPPDGPDPKEINTSHVQRHNSSAPVCAR